MVGSACPNARIGSGRFLLDLAGHGFCGIYFAGAGQMDSASRLFDKLRASDQRFTGLVVINSEDEKAISIVHDPNGEVFRTFNAQPDTFYLLRPDLHIAGRWLTVECDEVMDTLARNLERGQVNVDAI